MKRLKTLLLAVMAALSLGAVVASAAVTPGLLPLSETSFSEAGIAFTGTSGAGTLTTPAKKPISCTADTAKGTFGSSSETSHIVLGKVTITLTGCNKKGLAAEAKRPASKTRQKRT